MPDVTAKAYVEIFGSQVSELKQAYESLKQIDGTQNNPKLDDLRYGIENAGFYHGISFPCSGIVNLTTTKAITQQILPFLIHRI